MVILIHINMDKYIALLQRKTKLEFVFDEMVKFINADEELGELFKIKDYESVIECLLTNSKIKALSSDVKAY